MGKAFGSLFFFGVLAFAGWLILSSMGGRDVFDVANLPDEALSSNKVADSGAEAARDLDAVLDDALRNAERAQKIAAELEVASERAYEAAGSVSTLVSTNSAAAASRATTVIAAQNADRTAALMRSYADELQMRLREAERLAEEAEEAAMMVASVEESKLEAQRAAMRAREAEEDLIKAARNAEMTERAGSLVSGRVGVTEEIIATDDVIVDDGPEAIIVVPIDDLDDADAPTDPY